MRVQLLRDGEISLELLIALSTLSLGDREAWIDTYVLGSTRSTGSTQQANERLRRWFGSVDNLREVA